MSLSAHLLIARATAAARTSARERRSQLEREMAGYRSAADRQDFEAILDRYPDKDTAELRDILSAQAMRPARQFWPSMHRQHPD